jgi:pilus assembly protein Flp/PilA
MLDSLRFMAAMLVARNTRKSEEGATAVEYGLMVALIAVGIITAVVFLEDSLSGLFNSVGSTL